MQKEGCVIPKLQESTFVDVIIGSGTGRVISRTPNPNVVPDPKEVCLIKAKFRERADLIGQGVPLPANINLTGLCLRCAENISGNAELDLYPY